jgi:hypothetical protein
LSAEKIYEKNYKKYREIYNSLKHLFSWATN